MSVQKQPLTTASKIAFAVLFGISIALLILMLALLYAIDPMSLTVFGTIFALSLAIDIGLVLLIKRNPEKARRAAIWLRGSAMSPRAKLLSRAMNAAWDSGAFVILKGADLTWRTLGFWLAAILFIYFKYSGQTELAEIALGLSLTSAMLLATWGNDDGLMGFLVIVLFAAIGPVVFSIVLTRFPPEIERAMLASMITAGVLVAAVGIVLVKTGQWLLLRFEKFIERKLAVHDRVDAA